MNLASLRILLVDGVFVMRLGLILDALGWSVLLALPGETFRNSHGYDLMAWLLPERVWAGLFGLEALACAAGLFLPPGRWRSLAPVGGAVLYGLTALSMARTVPLSTGSIAYAVVLLDCYWLIWMEGRARQRAALSRPRPRR